MMIKRTTAIIFLFLGSAIAAMSQTNGLRPEVKTSGDISPSTSVEVHTEFSKLNYFDMDMLSPYPDPYQKFRLQKPNLSLHFPALKQPGIFVRYSPYIQFMTSHPLAFDFDNIQTDKLTNRFFILSNGGKVTHIGLGEYIQLSSSLGWQPSKKLTINAGGVVGKQYAYANLTQNDIIGASIKTKYSITDNVQFNSWGQYTNSGDNNSLSGFNTLFPHSGIGSSLSVKIKSSSKIEGGVEYQYNESTKVWNLESQGKVSLHF
ncbi:MAG TPA: hypothetical protein VIK20_03210 [Bacteroidales bacterium]